MAFSGGADSTALLVALIQLYPDQQPVSIRALHFNHRIHPHAQRWQQHCEALCRRFNIAFEAGIWSQSPGRECNEGDARQARYQWLSTALKDGEVLLTAHHGDDQVETVLMNLLQGRGLHRLGGIPAVRNLGQYESLAGEVAPHQGNQVARPLLNFSHKALCDFLAGQEISWIDDPANHQVDHRRSFLRHEVLPVIRQQFGDCDAALRNSADRFRETDQVLEQVAAAALEDALEPARRRTFCLASPLNLDILCQQPQLMQPRIIRHWIHSAGLGAPTDKQLGEMIRQLHRFSSENAKTPGPNGRLNGTALRWGSHCMVVHGQWLYLIDQVEVDRSRVQPFRAQPSALPGNLESVLVRIDGPGLSVNREPYTGLEWRWRQGGEEFHQRGARSPQSLKKLFQEIGKPEFERRQMPLLCQHGELLWVHGLGFSEALHQSEFRAENGAGHEPVLRRQTG